MALFEKGPDKGTLTGYRGEWRSEQASVLSKNPQTLLRPFPSAAASAAAAVCKQLKVLHHTSPELAQKGLRIFITTLRLSPKASLPYSQHSHVKALTSENTVSNVLERKD